MRTFGTSSRLILTMTSDIEASVCWFCVTGLHEECPELIWDDETERAQCCCRKASPDTDAGAWQTEIGRPTAKPGDITDVLSTGRKRADMLYPIFDGMVCEWAGLKFAGGGVEPIVGCRGNVLHQERGQYARHHGPNKSTLENGPLNVHRICYVCHNRWHAANNEFYGKARPEQGAPWLPVEAWLPHDPDTKASEQEIEDNERYWATRKADRATEED